MIDRTLSRTYVVPTLQVRGAKLIGYNQVYSSYTGSRISKASISDHLMSSEKFVENVESLRKTAKYTGVMTEGAKKRLRKAVSLLVNSTPKRYHKCVITGRIITFHLSFTTLTMPITEKSKDAKFCHKHLLEPLLRILRKRHGMKSYIWKCELQKNDSIHYHLTSDCYISHTTLRNEWNNLLRKHGMLEDFKRRYGHDNPNSTDIHSTRDVKDLEAYLIKYISKEYQNEKSLNGKVWDCSSNIKQGKYFSFELDTVTREALDRAMSRREVSVTQLEKCTVYKFPSVDHLYYYLAHIKRSISSHYNNIRQWVKSTTQQTQKKLNTLERSLEGSLQSITNTGKQLTMLDIGIFGY